MEVCMADGGAETHVHAAYGGVLSVCAGGMGHGGGGGVRGGGDGGGLRGWLGLRLILLCTLISPWLQFGVTVQ